MIEDLLTISIFILAVLYIYLIVSNLFNRRRLRWYDHYLSWNTGNNDMIVCTGICTLIIIFGVILKTPKTCVIWAITDFLCIIFFML